MNVGDYFKLFVTIHYRLTLVWRINEGLSLKSIRERVSGYVIC